MHLTKHRCLCVYAARFFHCNYQISRLVLCYIMWVLLCVSFVACSILFYARFCAAYVVFISIYAVLCIHTCTHTHTHIYIYIYIHIKVIITCYCVRFSVV